jgi:hypothetical protein
VLAGRDGWIDDFDGEHFTVGRSWYTHFEQSLERDYFTGVRKSDAQVEQCCPGLQETMIGLIARVTGERAARRDSYCGPGVHIFPAGRSVARQGGDLHYDLEGLAPTHMRDRVPAITVVLMLSPAERAAAFVSGTPCGTAQAGRRTICSIAGAKWCRTRQGTS